uniref:Uncharacterized protein n=1 Tax=uncultured prokaryote TaxID=198431 RepID=A0A0H5QNG5_9ZZZZ|nr:hypothetical protein [uncultured prokaryote]
MYGFAPNHPLHDVERQNVIRRMSRYRQVRLTFTQETSGRLSYSVYAKGMQDGWNEHHLILRDQVRHAEPLVTIEDVYGAIMAILREQMLPGSLD